MAFPYFEGFPLRNEPYPNSQKGLPGIFDAHARPVSISKSQRGCADSINVVVENVIPLAGHLIDSVYIDGPEEMIFVDRKVIRFAVHLSSAREHDLNRRIMLA